MKKLLSLVICLIMVLTLLPVGAAALDDSVEIIGKTLLSGQYLATVDADPADIVGTTPDSYVAMYRDGVLTLNDFEKPIYNASSGIVSENDLTVELRAIMSSAVPVRVTVPLPKQSTPKGSSLFKAAAP
ncbi:MAG TPA: hypothetical protein PLU75_01095 [Oscillospiraceae bacterium]|nr:hypothetical protein [Oscillospiraceae bacterium]HRW57653.1 hypothetical protein [Oscillospiraceae bacterium]